MATSQPTHSNDIDIISLWHGLRRSLRTLLVLTLLAGLGTFVVLSLMAPRYTSEAQLAISAKVTNPFPDGKDGKKAPEGLTQRLDREAINTHVNALRAPDLLLKVAQQLKLEKRAEFGGSDGGVLGTIMQLVGIDSRQAEPASEEKVINAVRKRLQVVAARESRFITVKFSSQDPRLAADFANALAETYRQSLVDVPVNETQQVVNALLPKIEQLKKELLVSEAEVERFRAQTDQFRSGAQSTPVNARRMAALNDELIKSETARSAAESKWKTAKEMSTTGNVEILPEVQKSPVIQRLIEQRVRVERQVAEARASLLPAHPRMRQLNSDLGRVRSAIRSEVRNVVRGLEKEFRTQDFRVQDIRREINSLKVKVVDTSENEARLKSLESSAKSKRSELERLQRQLEDNKTLVVTKTVPVEAQIVSLGRPSAEPTFPKKGPFTLIVMAAAFILGLALVTAKEIIMAGRAPASHAPVPQGIAARRQAPAMQAEIEVEEDVAPAPVVSALQKPPRRSVPAVVKNTLAIEDIVGRLLRSGQGVAGYRTVIAGDHQMIDASLEGMAIANEASLAGKQVAVVDWNVSGETFGADNGISISDGILDLLDGSASFEDIIANVPESRVHYITAGSSLEFEDQDLDADGLNAVLDALDEAYDHVIVIGRFGAAQSLFEAIQGRFDAGILVSEGGKGADEEDSEETVFLGFEVTDIDIMNYYRSGTFLSWGELPRPSLHAACLTPGQGLVWASRSEPDACAPAHPVHLTLNPARAAGLDGC